jgi:hypothetical protein
VVPAEQQHQLLCPRGDGKGTLTIPMSDIFRWEGRMVEVASVTPMKAPELLSTMNKAWLEAGRVVIALEYQLVQAKKAASERKAVVLLDEVPKVLAAKGFNPARAGEDMRNAVLAQDADYQAALDRQANIEAVAELLRLKQKGFENSYTSVKKILGTNPANLPGQKFGGGGGGDGFGGGY